MKKKFVVALVAAMSLTVAGTGTVFAMDKVSTVASEKEHVHGDNCEWIVDKEAWTETVEHPEEGHYETVVVKPAWDEEVHRIGTFCHNCGFEIHSIDEWIAHSEASNGQCMSYGDKEVTEIIHHEAVVEQQWKVDKPAWTEGEDSGLFKKYRLNRGFTNYLLDGNGVIIAKNISAADLSAYVSEIG